MNKYATLEIVLNKCIEKWRKPWWWDQLHSDWLDEDWINLVWWWSYSYHDLFSVDSWLLKHIMWRSEWDFIVHYCDWEEYERWWQDSYYHLILMSVMTAEEKVSYFLENIIDG